MKNVFRNTVKITAGIAVVASAAYVVSKIVSEISELPEENSCYKDKAKKYFYEKWENFKTVIQQKNSQIEDVMNRLKTDITVELDPEKRKELIDNATMNIAKIKDEMHDIIDARRNEICIWAYKLTHSTFVGDATAFFNKIAKNVKKIVIRPFVPSIGESDFPDEYDFSISINPKNTTD